jgi:SAM-dependent methyltransferase
VSAQQKPPRSEDGYNPDYFEPVYEIEERHFWFRARKRAIAAALQRQPSEPGARILEVGCGTGNVLPVLAEAYPDSTVVGMDLYGEGLRFAQRRVASPLVQGDMQHPPFSMPFDVVGLFDVLEHLPNDEEVLCGIRDLLSDQGALIITVPAHQALWSYFDEAAFHFRRYEPVELREKLVACGFEVEYLTPYMSATYPFVWLRKRIAALWPGKNRVDPDAMTAQELRVVPVLNSLLLGALRLEVGRIARRRTVPWGTSLLAIARPRKG